MKRISIKRKSESNYLVNPRSINCNNLHLMVKRYQFPKTPALRERINGKFYSWTKCAKDSESTSLDKSSNHHLNTWRKSRRERSLLNKQNHHFTQKSKIYQTLISTFLQNSRDLTWKISKKAMNTLKTLISLEIHKKNKIEITHQFLKTLRLFLNLITASSLILWEMIDSSRIKLEITSDQVPTIVKA